MVFIVVVSGVLDNKEFKKSSYRDPPRNLGEFYLEADRFLWEEDVTSEKKVLDVNMLKDGELSDYGNDKGKVTVKNDRNTQPRRGPRYEKYTELIASLSDIYMYTNGVVSYPKPPRREPSQRERDSGKHCLFRDMD